MICYILPAVTMVMRSVHDCHHHGDRLGYRYFGRFYNEIF